MKIQFESASHDGLTPNYRVRWYNGGPTPVHEQFWTHGSAVLVPASSPPVYELGPMNITKPNGPHTAPYTITVTAEATTGPSPESAPSLSFTLAPPDAPANVVVIDPAL